MEAWLNEDRAKAGKIPPRYWNATFELSRKTPAVERVREWAANEAPKGRALILCGPPRSGKTHAACCFVRHWEGKLFEWPRRCGEILDPTWDTLEFLKSTPFLAMDELGGEYVKPGGMIESQLEAILCARYNDLLATLITTNLAPSAMRDFFSDRVWARLESWADCCALGAIE